MSRESVIRKPTILGALQPDLKPWQRIDWPCNIQSRLYKDWGQCYNQRLFNNKALESFSNALHVCKEQRVQQSCQSFLQVETTPVIPYNFIFEAYTTLDKRSRCLRSMGRAREAFEDSEQAQKLMEQEGLCSSSIILAKYDALFDCNQFEENLCMLHIEERKFQGKSIRDRFKLHEHRTLAVLEESLGSNLNPFLLENWPFITDLTRERNKTVALMPLPMWQQLQENQECDVESIMYKKEISLPPLERARRRASDHAYNHHYMGSSAKDVALLRQLRSNENFLYSCYRESMPFLSAFTTEQYQIIKKFMKMMHSRKPMYQISAKNREEYLFRVEYQTRRDCFRILREVRRLREKRNIDRLTNYVENAMSTIIELKTLRTLPWKFEFITEIYNILALAHLDQRGVPRNLDFLDLRNHAILYLLPKDRMRDISNKFSARNIYADVDKDSARTRRYIDKVKKMEERLLHSRYGIEKAYLMFEIARSHFKESRFGKCTTMARKAVKEAINCNSIVWRFNSTFLICQVHAAFNRYERLKDSLEKATRLAEKLKYPQLLAYLALCDAVNEYELDYHRKRQPESNWRRQRKRKGQRQSQSSVESETV